MLAKKYRINTTVDFQNAMREGERVFLPGVKVFRVANEASFNRYGFIATKRVGNSVVRHHIVRVLRAVASQHLAGSYDYVFIPLIGFDEKFNSARLVKLLKGG